MASSTQLPGGYPVTPQREENIAEYNQATDYNQATPEHGKIAENITNNSPITSEYGNVAGENLEISKSDNNYGNSEYNFGNRKPEDNWENKRPEDDLENRKPEGDWENRKPEGDWENRKPEGDWENRKPEGDWENRKPEDDLENRKPEGDWENRKPNDDLENRKPNDDWENRKPEDDWENRKPNDDLENRKPEDDWENRKPNDDLENRKPEGDWENSKPEDTSENRKPENENLEKSKDDKIRESFPLRFEPNSSSMEATDQNDLAKVTNHGSSALGGIGINPAALIGGGDESPRHPYFEQKEKEEKEAAGGDKGAAEGEVDNSSTIKPSNIAGQKTYDLTGDYNEQKEQEQIAEHEANVAQEQDKDKPSETHPQKQKSEIKKPERIDLGVKPLGGQQLPLPYKPEEPAGNTDRAHQPKGKITEIHPEGPNAGAKITKKDKLNASINKAVGTFKQKIGKLTKNDNLVARGTEKKAEAERTKEFGDMRKEI